MSWNKTCRDWAVKYLSLISIRLEQKVKYVPWLVAPHMQYTLVAPLPSTKWNEHIRVTNVQSRYHSLFSSVSPRTSNIGNTLCNLFSGNLSHSDCQSSNTYLFTHDFKSWKRRWVEGIASLAAESAVKFPLMTTWMWTQIKTVSFPPLVNSIGSS